MCNHQKLVNTLGCCTLSSPGHQYKYTVEPPRKGHFGTNINSSGLSPL